MRMVLVALLIVVCVAVGMFSYTLSDSASGVSDAPDAPEELDEAHKDRLAGQLAMRVIAAQSRVADAPGGAAQALPAPVAVAPPGFVPAPAPVERAAVPPPGYSFTKYHEARRAPLPVDIAPDPDPPSGPPAWMASGPDDVAGLAAAAGRGWAYGWVKLASDADADRISGVLAAAGGELLGGPGDLVRARLPADTERMLAFASDPAVAGVGTTPLRRKMTATLAARARDNPGERVPIWITLMDADGDGRWRRALTDLGAEVGGFHPAVRAYAATVTLGDLERVVASDYVLAVETIGRVEPMLEFAGPAMGADAVRVFDVSAGAFVGVGGASVPVGVVDTGLNVNHQDISSGRRSICGASFATGEDGRNDDQDLWFDRDQHGTHVTGIVLGSGAGEASRAGMAPLVSDIRFAKGTSTYGFASALLWMRAINWLGKPTSCGGDPRKPLVINSSLGLARDFWQGRSVVERKIDATVWTARQLFVAAAGNSNEFALVNMASAKNALAVGAAHNIGDVAEFSSRGPTGDGRLMPKVVGTGVGIAAAAGAGRRQGYIGLSGTSMSSPAVVGVATLAMDALPELRTEPAAVRALLMASAIKPDAFMGDDEVFPLDNTGGPGTFHDSYGLGKASARTAVLNRDADDGWVGGTAAFEADAGEPYYVDVVVPDGASRLDVVLTWDEPPTETIANTVLHDLDLYISRHTDYYDLELHTSKSRIDNVEWTILREPPAGTYRLAVHAHRVYGAPPRVGLAWTVIRGQSTPALAVVADRERIDVAPDEPFDVEVTLSADAYVAAGTKLRIDCREEPGSGACEGLSYLPGESEVRRGDAPVRTLARDGNAIVVGEVTPGEERSVALRFPGMPAGGFQLYLAASAWNATSAATSVAVGVGGVGPPPPVERPPNDDFAAPEVLGAEGETSFDLVAATPGPGEPRIGGFGASGVPGRYRSLWYLWTAPDTGPVRFAVVQAMAGDYADNVIVKAFLDGPMAGLEPVGEGFLGGGTTFFAERGKSYRVRLAIHPSGLAEASTPRLTLRWGQGGEPDNDRYAHASVVDGASGSVEGHNLGATTEAAELEGPGSADYRSFVFNWLIEGWASSVWYRWTAPSSGDYSFSVDRRSLTLAAFTGDGVAEARLVSGLPRRGVVSFPATEGEEYRIGVATSNAYFSGTIFNLSWEPGGRASVGNDDLTNPATMTGDRAVPVFDNLTVQHGEPAESGVRTAWWAWTAPSDGRYTWRVVSLPGDGSDWHYGIPLRLSVFAAAAGELQPVATQAPLDIDRASFDIVFDATEGQSLRLAVGLPRDAALMSVRDDRKLAMELGPTPANDNVADAIPLVGGSGSLLADPRFATTERGERTGSLGDSSLWWSFEPSDTGWLMFETSPVSGANIAIYRVGDDGERALVRTSEVLGVPKVQFLAEAGARYLIRYGTTFYDPAVPTRGSQSSFRMTWQPTGAPAALRYVDLVRGEDIITYSANGERILVRVPVAQVFNADGTELYSAGNDGILAFGRDADTGRLTFLERVSERPVYQPSTVLGSRLVWDESGGALIVPTCGPWLKFAAKAGGGLEAAGEVLGAPCVVRGSEVLASGDFVLHQTANSIETYRFNDAHDALVGTGIVTFGQIAGAAVTADGRYVYVLGETPPELLVFERNPDDGRLAFASALTEGYPRPPEYLALSESHLFVTGGLLGRLVSAFDIGDPAHPAHVGWVRVPRREHQNLEHGHCRYPTARPGIPAVDLSCRDNLQFSTGVDPALSIVSLRLEQSGLFHATGVARPWTTDRFGNLIGGLDYRRTLVASPDGRHVYWSGFVGASALRILVFERVPNSPDASPVVQ